MGEKHHSILVIGGGTGGITVAAQLLQQEPDLDVAIVEPSERHFYQPIWTLVGAGVFPKETSMRPMGDFIPQGATWIRDAVETFDPEGKRVTTRSGDVISYDQLVVAVGLQLNWSAVKGLAGHVGKHGICSNYTYDTVGSTWDNLSSLSSGRAVFTHPATPVKCGGAPQKIMYLADDQFRRRGVRDRIDIQFRSGDPAIFAVTKYRKSLEKILETRDLHAKFRTHLVEVRPDAKEAVFENLDTGDTETLTYDVLHVTPPMGPPDFVKESPLAAETGWVEVDKHTLQHTRFPDVFALGDCSNLPTSKTGAAIRKQAPTVVDNLRAHRDGRPLPGSYDGYTSCPLVTGYGKLILAEFDYDKQPMESFPFDQSIERYSMYSLKAHALPRLYWHGMLRGRM